jgi:hypothetical protein
MDTPNIAFRVAIHNQIYFSKYYHISKYEKNSNGKFVYASSWGYRGKGNHLGMSYGEAVEKAKALNCEVGWNKFEENRPKWLIVD